MRAGNAAEALWLGSVEEAPAGACVPEAHSACAPGVVPDIARAPRGIRRLEATDPARACAPRFCCQSMGRDPHAGQRPHSALPLPLLPSSTGALSSGGHALGCAMLDGCWVPCPEAQFLTHTPQAPRDAARQKTLAPHLMAARGATLFTQGIEAAPPSPASRKRCTLGAYRCRRPSCHSPPCPLTSWLSPRGPSPTLPPHLVAVSPGAHIHRALLHTWRPKAQHTLQPRAAPGARDGTPQAQTQAHTQTHLALPPGGQCTQAQQSGGAPCRTSKRTPASELVCF